MLECKRKHTIFNPSDEEWRCPNCGNIDDFILEDPFSTDCELLHKDDVISCNGCGCSYTGKQFCDILLKRKNLIPCPHCKGTGLIPKE